MRSSCIGKSDFRKIEDSTDKPYYDRMHAKLANNKAYFKRLSRIRSKTVEPVLGTLLNYLNMRRVNTRGMAGANKHVLLSATAYNIKKLMKFNREKIKTVAASVQKVSLQAREDFYFLSALNQTPLFAF